MDIKTYWPWELPDTVEGNAVIIDINAATTNLCLILSRKVKELIIVNEDNVVALKRQYPECLVIGEGKKLPQEFFDANNCTSIIAKLPLENKTVLYMSNNGSRSIELGIKKGAKNVLVGCFTNIHAITNWLKQDTTERVYLVPAGDMQFKDPKVTEDKVCATAMEFLLEGKPVEWKKLFAQAREFISKNYADFSEEENEMQFSIDNYPAVPLCVEDEKRIIRVRNII